MQSVYVSNITALHRKPEKNTFKIGIQVVSHCVLTTRVLQNVLSLGSDYFSATFYQTYFYYKPSKYSPFIEAHFVTFLPSREKQINSLLLVSVGDTDK